MSIGISGSNSLSMETIQKRIAPALQSSERNVANVLDTLGADASPGELLKAQAAMSQWTLQAQLQSSLVKEVGDALKGIIQKSG